MARKINGHPADGLYTFSAKRARELGACAAHLNDWVDRHGEKVVPVTLADMSEQENCWLGSAALWCVDQMFCLGKITEDQYDSSVSAIYRTQNDEHRARALMDALLVRAKREGRA